MKKRKLVAAIACRNQGSRLYGKPLQNLDVTSGIKIIDNIIACIRTLPFIEEIVLGVSSGIENEVFVTYAKENGIPYVIGDEIDVLSRLIQCGQLVEASDIFRVTSESPFLYFQPVKELWQGHVEKGLDATFLDEIIDGCGFEIISMDALILSHSKGERKHRSELCSLYLREHKDHFKIFTFFPPQELIRKDLRLTVDNPEDLVVCRNVYGNFKDQAPHIYISEVVKYLDFNPKLKELISPFAEAGYSTMYK